MFRLFRQIRQRLLTDNKLSKYLLYAVGEILLLVIGILIALNVNNWNQERLQKERYQFGIEKVYNRILADFFYWETYRDRAEYQIIVIDSLLTKPDSIPPNRILGNLLILDELIREWSVREDSYLNYLQFFPTDSLQFNILEDLKLYFKGSWEDVRRFYIHGQEESFKKFLGRQNIPICDLYWGDSFDNFIHKCGSPDFIEEYSSDLLDLIRTKEMRSRFHLHQLRLRELLMTEFMPGSNILETLEESFDFLDRDIEVMEIIGSGISIDTLNNAVKMNPVPDRSLVWECNTTLKDGLVRFQTNRLNFNWGQGELNKHKLTFGGPHIPVKAGRYHIVVNLEENTYQLNPE